MGRGPGHRERGEPDQALGGIELRGLELGYEWWFHLAISRCSVKLAAETR